jgi:hypothetical protein
VFRGGLQFPDGQDIAISLCPLRAPPRAQDDLHAGAVQAIHAAGGRYDQASPEAIHGALQTVRRIENTVSYRRRQRPPFQEWRKKRRGEWLIVTTEPGWGGHLVSLKNGAARDNGWINHNNIDKQVVCAAWKLL